MLNFIWIALMLAAVLIGTINHTLTQVVTAVTSSAKLAVTIALSLLGIMTFWLGVMKIAEDAGFITVIARLLKPVMRKLFPDVPTQHPAMKAMLMNITANVFGLANAATPFGLRAMQQLEKLNPNPGVATHSMCLFLAINTSSVQLIPATAIAILSANGDTNPTAIILPTLIATSCSTIVAIVSAKLFAKLKFFQLKPTEENT
ncbi:MAG: nucleoside recognition protein [Gammaproteobacteria bacterium]|nr:nucleoside recognition protein [Gammaproteobacteria bacterium]